MLNLYEINMLFLFPACFSMSVILPYVFQAEAWENDQLVTGLINAVIMVLHKLQKPLIRNAIRGF